MKKVFIKYNPYKLETEITVDGKKLKENSKIGEMIRGKNEDPPRLQEWVEELPRMLVDEYNDDFEIEFHGTILDYEDITSVFSEANKLGKIKAEIKERIPGKETSDKEALIDEVFSEIQKGPFDELRNEEIINAFQQAKSGDFKVCVVATMSAGKSTLINAMIGSKLMPSKQEACTAIITRIKDISSDDIPFKAQVYDKNDRLMKSYESISLPDMESLNSDDNVSGIKIFGNIPFVTSEDVSLVLIDTPGPNNSRDPHHKEVQSGFLEKTAKVLVLYIMTGEFGTDDDNALLDRVAQSMKVGGKQSKDRFIFVINKLDTRDIKDDGDMNPTLDKVRFYLKGHGIENPNLFPAAALPALNIRMMKNNRADLDDDTIDDTETKVRKLNRNEKFHFEKYATLPGSIRSEIERQLEETRSAYEGPKNENQSEALIHTGVVSIEAAIRQYVQKYAKTAKIKNIVDIFMKKIKELDCYEKTKAELAKNHAESEKFVRQIATIREKMKNANEAKKFKDDVDIALEKVNKDSKELVECIIKKFQTLLSERFDKLRGRELDLDDAEYEAERLVKFAKELEPDFKVELGDSIRIHLVDTSDAMLEEYRKKLASLAEEVGAEHLAEVKIDPLKLMGGSGIYGDFSINKLERAKEVKDGAEFIPGSIWYLPWTWPKGKGWWRPTYKSIKYISGSELAQELFSSVQKIIFASGDSAKEYAVQQSKEIAEHFNLRFNKLDEVLKDKLDELEEYATNKEKADERIRESESRLKWLENIMEKVESKLEI